jgi:hypothetical protein
MSRSGTQLDDQLLKEVLVTAPTLLEERLQGSDGLGEVRTLH